MNSLVGKERVIALSQFAGFCIAHTRDPLIELIMEMAFHVNCRSYIQRKQDALFRQLYAKWSEEVGFVLGPAYPNGAIILDPCHHILNHKEPKKKEYPRLTYCYNRRVCNRG